MGYFQRSNLFKPNLN